MYTDGWYDMSVMVFTLTGLLSKSMGCAIDKQQTGRRKRALSICAVKLFLFLFRFFSWLFFITPPLSVFFFVFAPFPFFALSCTPFQQKKGKISSNPFRWYKNHSINLTISVKKRFYRSKIPKFQSSQNNFDSPHTLQAFFLAHITKFLGVNLIYFEFFIWLWC